MPRAKNPMTPTERPKQIRIEKDVKQLVRHYLEAELKLIPASKAAVVTHEHNGWYYMPMQNGQGVTGIPDFLGHCKGQFFAIETKRPGEEPTALQVDQLHAIDRTGALSYVYDGSTEEDIVRIVNEIKEVSGMEV